MDQNEKIKLPALEQSSWLERRLQELRSEFKQGEAQLAELDRQRAQLRDTLLRISGAIQVLEEGLASERLETLSHLPVGNGVVQPVIAA